MTAIKMVVLIVGVRKQGYRVIAADAPAVWNHLEWVSSFEKFLDALGVHQVHLYGTSLGGFLAQLFAQYRPRRVKSLLLSNTFLDNWDFEAIMPWASLCVHYILSLLS
jgi:maspardin